MDRLTEKLDNETMHYDMGKHYEPNDIVKYIVDVNNKLGQLEDFEEELGVNLIILLKAICKEYIYVKPNKIIRKFEMEFELNKDNDGWFFDFPVDFFDRYKNEDYVSIYLKDYGKTWALTREELENEK